MSLAPLFGLLILLSGLEVEAGFSTPLSRTPPIPNSRTQEAVPAPASWRWLQEEDTRVGYRDGDSLRAAQVLTFLRGLPPLRALPDSLPVGVTLFIAPNPASFDSLAGGAVPEWSAGVAVPSLGRIVIPGFGVQRSRGWNEARVIQHEWAHLALHQQLSGLRIPRWFDEGFSQWASGGWDFGGGWRLRVALALGKAPPLDSLVLDWPRDQASAELAYLLSATAVEYLASGSGERGLRILLDRWREGRTFSSALRRVYGLTPGQFEEDWKKYVKRRYGWLFVLSHSAVFWLLLSLALLLMVRVRRGRNRLAMAHLRATEPPDEPAYWDEPPEGTNPAPERSPERDPPGKDA